MYVCMYVKIINKDICFTSPSPIPKRSVKINGSYFKDHNMQLIYLQHWTNYSPNYQPRLIPHTPVPPQYNP